MDGQVRSLRQGQVSEDEVRGLLGRFADAYKTRATLEVLAETDSSSYYDIFVASGDLEVAGDLDMMKEEAGVLVVDGSLTVQGAYSDYDDPETFLLVTGDMSARDVQTAGWLEVHGNLTVGSLIGDYNDCGAWIGGDVRARLFYGEEHHFTIGGRLMAGAVIGRPRLDIAVMPPVIELDDVLLLHHLDPELVDTEEDDDGNIIAVGGIDFRAIKQRVAAGIPLRVTQP